MSSTSLVNSPWLPTRVKRTQCFLLSLDGSQSNRLSLPIRRGRFRFSSPRVSRFKVEACWIPPDEISSDGFGGWFTETPKIVDRDGWKKYVVVGIAAPVVIMLAGFTYYTYRKKGIRFSVPAPIVSLWVKTTKSDRDIEASQDSESKQDESTNVSLDKLKETIFSGTRFSVPAPIVSLWEKTRKSDRDIEASQDSGSKQDDSTNVSLVRLKETIFSGIRFSIPAPIVTLWEKTTKSDRDIEASQDSESKQDESTNVSLHKLEETIFSGYRFAITVPADTAQEHALSVLKKLQIVEIDANANELCTRREFARWFVKLSSYLERSKSHKVTPSVLVTKSVVSAFDDVEINDPDFWFIQCLGEAGFVPSKLSSADSSSSGSNFLPESYLSRFDMLNWKSLVEYATNTKVDMKITDKKPTVLDLSACPGVSTQLFTDLVSGESSIFSRVFGNTRLIQPYKPVTKAQAAVALTSGRMEELINEELTRIEVETRLKLSEMEDIKRDLIQKGEIEKIWKARIEEEQKKEIKSQEALEDALLELRKERKEREEGLSENMKEKIALDSERAILLGLKKEIDDLSERVIDENNQVTREKFSIEKIFMDVNRKYESLIETKSRLEAEKEAVHVLRSWVEEEANRLQTRANIMEQAVGRWRFSGNEDSVGKDG